MFSRTCVLDWFLLLVSSIIVASCGVTATDKSITTPIILALSSTYAISWSAGAVAYVVLRRMSFVSISQHRRRFTFDDLHDRTVVDTIDDARLRSDHQVLFVDAMTAVTSVAISLAVQWAQQTFSSTPHATFANLASFVGGLMALVTRVQGLIGKILLVLLRMRQRQRRQRLRTMSEDVHNSKNQKNEQEEVSDW